MSRTYLYNAIFLVERLGEADRKRAAKVADAWEPSPEGSQDSHGNLAMAISLRRDTLKAEAAPWVDNQETHAPLSEAIPSALALYRLLCLYPCHVQSPGPDGYKCVWSTTLRHKATGLLVDFGDSKAGFQIWTSYSRPADVPPALLKDLLALLSLLCGPKCPHPYDGTVAGSVA